MITPTPRAMSPHDIVRIYVPPAPPDEQQHIQQKLLQPTTANESGRFVTKESQPNSLPLFTDSSSAISILSNNNINSSQETPKQLMSLEFPCTESNNKNSIIYGSGELTPVHYSLHRSDEELVKSFSESISGHSLSHISNAGGVGATAIVAGQRSTSSSRRGSLSRKSPLAMFESNTLMECSHILAKRRLSTQSNGLGSDNRIKLSIGNSSSENLSTLGQPTSLSLLRRNSLSNGESTKIMTSFEQLATSRHQTDDAVDRGETPIRITTSKRHEILSPDDDETYSYSYYNSYKSAESRQRKSPAVISDNIKKYVSESNIQYKSFSAAKSCVDEPDRESTASNKRRPHSSGIETSPFQYADPATLPPSHNATSIKEYKRLYSTSVDDDVPEHEHEHGRIRTNEENEEDEPIKSSDDSSSSPVSKSVVITPVNETIPLLQSSPISAQHKPQIINQIYDRASPTANMATPAHSQFKMKSPSHIPVAMTQSTKVKSPTSSPDQTSPLVRPSRIPLVYNNQKILSATVTSPVMHSSSSASSLNSPNDLNRILPPVEVVTSAGSRTSNDIHTQLRSSDIDNSKILSSSTTPNGSSFEFNGKRMTKRVGTSMMTTTTTTTTTASNAIRIHVNTNDQN